MNFDWKQQVKGYVVGAASAFAAQRLGLPTDQAVTVGVVIGGVFDIVYFLVIKALSKPNEGKE